MTLAICFIVIGILLLYVGAELIVVGASHLATKFRIHPLIFGVTVVSVATSLPEAITSFFAQLFGGRGDLCLGNALGSNIANIGLILGLCSLVCPLPISGSIKRRESWLCLLATLAFLVVMLFGAVTAIAGAVLLGFFVGYILFQMYLAKNRPLEVEGNTEDLSVSSFGAVKLGIGVVLLLLGGYLLVDGSSDLARFLGISERVIGVTVVAIGTSSPELFTSLVAALRKETDIAIGNIIGSNIFNLTFIVGGASLIRPIEFSHKLLTIDLPVLLGFTLFLFYLLQVKKSVSRLSASILFGGYVAYMLALIT